MTDHQHPTAKPEGEGAPVDEAMYWFLKVLDVAGVEVPAGDTYCAVAAFCDDRGSEDDTYNLSEKAGWSRTTHSGWGDGVATVSITDAGRAVLWDAEAKRRAALSASPPVPAVAGAWDSLIDYLENQTAETEEGRAIIAEWIAQAKALNGPTPSADQSGVIGALVEALTAAEPLIETLHSIVTTPEVRKVVWRDLSKVRQALAAHAASIEGKS